MNKKILFATFLTGILLFLYVLLINTQGTTNHAIAEVIKASIFVGLSIIIVDVFSFLIVDVWFVVQSKKKPSELLRFVVIIALYAPCAFIIFHFLGKDITALAATSALLGAILGFGLQSPLTNFFSGILLQVHQPFNIGDHISLENTSDGTEGTIIHGVVVAIDWRTTTLCLDSEEIVYIPNVILAESAVRVIKDNQPSYEAIEFKVPAASPPNRVIQVVLQAVSHDLNPNIDAEKPIFVRMWDYDLDEITYRLFYYPILRQKVEVLTNPELRRRIWYALSRSGFGNHYQIRDPQSVITLTSEIECFQGLSRAAQHLLASTATILLFDADESIQTPRSLLLIIEGTITIDQRVTFHNNEPIITPFSHRPKVLPKVTLPLPKLDIVATRLAQYLGPAAFPITYEVAKTESSLYWIYEALAVEIFDRSDRADFLQHQPVAPTEQFRQGDVFGEMALFVGEPLPDVSIRTLEETEMLAITPEAILKALNQDNYSLAQFSQQVAHYYDRNLRGTLQALVPEPRDGAAIAAQVELYLQHLQGIACLL